MDFEGDCRIQKGIIELAFALSILLRLIVECFDWNAPIFRIESSSSHWTDFEMPKTFVRPPRKPPDKRISSEQTISRIQSILLFRPNRLIVEWKSLSEDCIASEDPTREPKISQPPQTNRSRAENLSKTPKQVTKTRIPCALKSNWISRNES